MNWLDYLAIAVFFAALFGIAAACSRRAGKDAKDFFLSGRSMPWWLIGISMCAASTSTNSANMFTEFIRNSSLGGFRGAIYTDFFLFAVIMLGAFVGMHYAINHPAVGGFSAMMAHPAVQSHLSFFPDPSNADLFVAVFVIPVAIQWWNVWYPGSEPGGGGYIVQRMLSAKSEGHCVGGSILYQVVDNAAFPPDWFVRTSTCDGECAECGYCDRVATQVLKSF